jgi:hypothetical protein
VPNYASAELRECRRARLPNGDCFAIRARVE